MSIIFAKICPKHIEATSFSLLASVSNFRGTIRSYLGAYINTTWVGVTESDLSKYYVLVTIGFFCSFLPLLFIWLIPSRKEIDDLQASMRESSNEESLSDEETNGHVKKEEESSLLEQESAHSTKPSMSGTLLNRSR